MPVPNDSHGGLTGAPLMKLASTSLAERYEVVRQVGEGSMGVVYECVDRTPRRTVAIKILKGEHTCNPTFRRRFEREARSASSIHHPNVVEILGFGQIVSNTRHGEGPPYIVMEYLEGVDLRALLRREAPLAPARCRDLLHQVLAGLAAAHRVGIVHRDIKPANCFITREGDVESLKLLDFGVAKVMNETAASAGLTGVSEVIGTAAYLAPELALGSPAQVASDIYAVGVVAYQMISGRTPFVGSDPFEIMTKHVKEAPPPLERTIPADLRTTIMRALSKQPAQRFASMDDMARSLEPRAPRPSVSQSGTKPITSEYPPASPRVRPTRDPDDEAPTLILAGVVEPEERQETVVAPTTDIYRTARPSPSTRGDASSPVYRFGDAEDVATADASVPRWRILGNPANTTMVILALAFFLLASAGAVATAVWRWQRFATANSPDAPQGLSSPHAPQGLSSPHAPQGLSSPSIAE